MRQDREHGFTPRTLETPDADPTQADPDIMGVAGQASTSTTGRFVCELKAQGQDEGHHTFDKRLAISKQSKVGRLVSKIDGNGAVSAGLASGVSHGSPSGQMVDAVGVQR